MSIVYNLRILGPKVSEKDVPRYEALRTGREASGEQVVVQSCCLQ